MRDHSHFLQVVRRLLPRLVAGAVLPAAIGASTLWAQALPPGDGPKDAAEKPGAKAQQPGSDKAAKPKDSFKVPEGNAERQADFIREMFNTEPPAKNRAELIDYVQKMSVAVSEAADRILAAQNADEKPIRLAVQAKYELLVIRQQLGDADSLDAMFALAARLESDERPAVIFENERAFLIVRVQNFDQLDDKQRQRLVDDIVARLKSEPAGQFEFSLAMTMARATEMLQQHAAAALLYDAMAASFEKAESPELRTNADKMKGSARRNRLPGNAIRVEGKTFDGKEFDWAAYKGKVVLVDFWATWCGPCVEELPNVIRNYRKYHDRGFEVVGVSLDREKAELVDFLDRRQLPWPTLFSDNPHEQGWDNPIAVYYGIMSLPTTILVDRTGKVVSLSVRGDELEQQLEKLLGPAEPKDEKPASGK